MSVDPRVIDPDELVALRKGAGWTQAELAAALGLPRNTVARWELGTRRPPPFLVIAVEAVIEAHGSTPTLNEEG